MGILPELEGSGLALRLGLAFTLGLRLGLGLGPYRFTHHACSLTDSPGGMKKFLVITLPAYDHARNPQ